MTTTRDQLERNLNLKKRPRIPSTEDSISVEQRAIIDDPEPSAADESLSIPSSDEENRVPVQFQGGTTQKGGVCLWHKGYKFIKKSRSWFRCCQKTCKSTARLDDKQQMTGRLGPTEHNHCPVFAQQSAEGGRTQIKQMVKDNPRAKPSHLRAQVRQGAADETFDQLGTNDALDRMVQRQKNKLVGSINVADPLQINFALEMLTKDGESVLLYDSRTKRVNETPSLVSYNSSSFHTNDSLHDHPYALQFGRPSPRPSTPTMASSVDSERVQRWSLPLVQRPKFNVNFWNVFHRAQAAMERTNNGMEAAHGQFARDLNHHPSLSDFLAAFIKDIDKQCDIAQALRLGKIRNRRPKYVIKEQRIIEILETAMFGTNEELMEATDLLGLVMQGFVGGLHVRNNGTDEDSDAELDSFSDLDLL